MIEADPDDCAVVDIGNEIETEEVTLEKEKEEGIENESTLGEKLKFKLKYMNLSKYFSISKKKTDEEKEQTNWFWNYFILISISIQDLYHLMCSFICNRKK